MKQVANVNNVSWREIPNSPWVLPGNTLWVTVAKKTIWAVGWSGVKWRTSGRWHCICIFSSQRVTAWEKHTACRYMSGYHRLQEKCNRGSDNTEQIALGVLHKLVGALLPDHLIWPENTSNILGTMYVDYKTDLQQKHRDAFLSRCRGYNWQTTALLMHWHVFWFPWRQRPVFHRKCGDYYYEYELVLLQTREVEQIVPNAIYGLLWHIVSFIAIGCVCVASGSAARDVTGKYGMLELIRLWFGCATCVGIAMGTK